VLEWALDLSMLKNPLKKFTFYLFSKGTPPYHFHPLYSLQQE
jgi:hypothetical protein